AGFDFSSFTPQAKVIMQALKTYGMIVADNGSNWFISGSQDVRWNDDDLNHLKTVLGSNFEAVDTSSLIPGAASACDANGDGTVNVLDVQSGVIQAIGVAPCVMDLNHDGVCNVVDVQRVINS